MSNPEWFVLGWGVCHKPPTSVKEGRAGDSSVSLYFLACENCHARRGQRTAIGWLCVAKRRSLSPLCVGHLRDRHHSVTVVSSVAGSAGPKVLCTVCVLTLESYLCPKFLRMGVVVCCWSAQVRSTSPFSFHVLSMSVVIGDHLTSWSGWRWCALVLEPSLTLER